METSFDDKRPILVGIELEKNKIPCFIFYRGVFANPITREKILDSYFNLKYNNSDNLLTLEKLKKEIDKEISLIEANNESPILWIICVNSFLTEEKKNKLRQLFVDAGLIHSFQDKSIMILEKGVALTSYFEKEHNIKIEVGNPYIIIIFNEVVECLQKNDINGQDQFETAIINCCKFSDYNEAKKSGYDKLKRCLFDILCQLDRESRNKLKILFYGSNQEFYHSEYS